MNQDIRDFMLMGLSYEDACEQARLKAESQAANGCIEPPKAKRHKSKTRYAGDPYVTAAMIPCKDHTGQRYEDDKAMCKRWDIDIEVYRARKAHGWSVEEALTTPPSEKWFKKCVKKMTAKQAAKVGQAIRMFNRLMEKK